jgi:putative DNA primase/helicase
LVFVEELGGLNESQVKLLTSQTPLQARRMREDPWTFPPTHNIIGSKNDEPSIHGSDEGIWRRVKLLSWDVRIADREQDGDLGLRLREDADYVLTWLIRGYQRYRKRGLSPPQSVRTENREFRDTSDPVHAWIAIRCETDLAYQETSDALWTAFSAWHKSQKLEPVSRKRFGLALGQKGFRKGRVASGILWRGLRLLTTESA